MRRDFYKLHSLYIERKHRWFGKKLIHLFLYLPLCSYLQNIGYDPYKKWTDSFYPTLIFAYICT